MAAESTPHRRTTRLLAASVGGGLTVALTVGLAACSPAEEQGQAEGKRPIPHQEFVTRPDLKPPVVEVTEGPAWSDEYAEAEELSLISPNYGSETPSDGSIILDAAGELVWMEPASDEDKEDNPFDLRVQEYRGEPVVTYFEGSSVKGQALGMGLGEVVVLDSSYEEIARVTTGGDLGAGNADFHDTTITEDGTMLLGAYVTRPADLSELGGPEDGYVQDGVIQEVDIASGEVVFEWSSLDHVPVTDTLVDFDEEQSDLTDEVEKNRESIEAGEFTEVEAPPEGDPVLGSEDYPFDYFHLNSITEDGDGALLLSARHTSAVYQVDRTSGEVNWVLGGTAGDFELGEGAEFAWQHDAHRREDGTITLFDNHAHGGDDDESSRGLRLALDEEAMTAEVVTEYLPPQERVSGSMANAQQLPGGGMLLGWGARPFYSEYTAEGELIYDVCHGDECMGDDFEGGGGSYRAYKSAWEGHPSTDPDVVVQSGEAGENGQNGEDNDAGPVAYVSWNGATEVDRWRLVAGADEAGATEVATVDRDGFETSIPVPADAADSAYLAVEALDAEGTVLGTGTPQAD